MTILQDLEAARDALEKCRDWPGAYDECAAALSRLSTLIEQVDAEPFVWVDVDAWKSGKQWADDCFSPVPLDGWKPLYTSPTPAAAPEFDSAPQVSRNFQTGIKPAVDVERLELPPMPKASGTVEGTDWQYWDEDGMDAYARAALRMHLTGGK